MAFGSQETIKVVGGVKLAPYASLFKATMASTGKLTITAADLHLKNITHVVMTANNAGTGVGEIAYTTTDMASAVTSIDVEVIKDESTLVNAGQLTGIAFGDVN
jgi:hypothetical protein